MYTVNAEFAISFEPMPSKLNISDNNRCCENPGVGENTLIFLYIRRLGSFLGVQNFEFQYFFFFFFLVFRKINIFWSMNIFWIFFGSLQKLDYILVVISMHFRFFF